MFALKYPCVSLFDKRPCFGNGLPGLYYVYARFVTTPQELKVRYLSFLHWRLARLALRSRGHPLSQRVAYSEPFFVNEQLNHQAPLYPAWEIFVCLLEVLHRTAAKSFFCSQMVTFLTQRAIFEGSMDSFFPCNFSPEATDFYADIGSYNFHFL